MNKNVFFEAFKITIPIFFGYVSIGIPFGVMMVQAGYHWSLALFMSVFMYTGAGQYTAVGLFTAGLGVFQIALTEFFVNIRHIVYGLSLIEKFKGTGKAKPYLIFALTDETYALLASLEVPNRISKTEFYFYISFLNQAYWILGTIIGSLLCTILERHGLSHILDNIDFALTALFVVILTEQISKTKNIFSPLVGSFCCLVAILLYRFSILPSAWIIITATAAALSLVFVVKGREYLKND